VLPLLPQINSLLKANKGQLQIMRVTLPSSAGSVIGIFLQDKCAARL
jgi:hypothetical protein